MPRDIRSHTALRGIAATMVMLLHYRWMTAGLGDIDTLTLIFERAFACVDLFFLLSGFVLSHVYAGRLEGAGWPAVRQYIVNRLARIWPLHMATVLVMLIFIMAHRPVALWEWRDLVLNALLMQAWFLQDHFSFNAPNWSVSAEWMAYLLFPLLLSVRRDLLFIACAVIIFLLGYGLFEWTKAQVPFEMHQKYYLMRALPAFMMGMAIYRLAPAFAGLSGSHLFVLQVMAATGTLAAMHFGAPLAVIVLPMAVLVLATATDRGPLTWLLDRRLFVYLGELSYAVYLLHTPVMIMAIAGFAALGGDKGNQMQLLGAFVFCVLVTFIGAAVVYAWFERPARAWIRRLPMRLGYASQETNRD